MGAPRRARLYMLVVLFVAVLLEQLLLPDGHPLREATGGSPALWLLLGGFGVLALIYGLGVAALRRRAEARAAPPAEAPRPAGRFSDGELERYARHIVLREIGGPGQTRLKAAKVLVIGAGGLGAPALQYLAAGGVGTIGVIDDDVVENANLQRQVIHRAADIGMPKVLSAQAAMLAQNPAVAVRPYHRRLTPEIAADLFADYDLILDGTDNFDTRYLANRHRRGGGQAAGLGGAVAMGGAAQRLRSGALGAPCYQCIFPQAPAPGLAPSCAEAGVIGPLPGVIGAMMAVEAIKLISGAGTPLRGQMLIYDALYGETRTIALARRADCPVCGSVTAAP